MPVRLPVCGRSQAKAALDDMVRGLNEEASQLSEMKLRVRAADLQQRGLSPGAAHQQAQARGAGSSCDAVDDWPEFVAIGGESSDEGLDDVSSSSDSSSASKSGVWEMDMVQALQKQHKRWVRSFRQQLANSPLELS
eukprot:363873-Chlamydomonas_euryale.AAC.6